MDDGFQSEIRESEIQALEDKVASSDYGQYLRRVTLTKVRAFSEREVRFDFPVTALVGPNGGGKTTVLGAAGIIYRTVAPSRFFAKSGAYDASMTNWRIEYELVDRSLNPRLPVQRTASFLKLKWNRTAVERRQVLIFGVTRTVPASERRELAKAVGSSFVANSTVTLSKAVVDAVQAVLGKPMEGYNRLNVDELGRVHLFAAVTSKGSYSEFHFGAGEASIIRMISEIEEASDNCLILIEEIENGLHPVATRRMVEYLIDVARRKSAQVIFTSHSNDALAPLPGKAIWAGFDGEVMQGELDVRALRTITGQVDAALAVYVEDEFAELMLRVALTSEQGIAMTAIKIHAMGGANPAMQVNKHHNLDPTSSFPSICVLDGDQAALANAQHNIFVLPGTTSPEAHVFDFIHDKLDGLAAKLAVMLGLPISEQERVKAVIRSRALTNRDRHVIWEQIGEDLDFRAALIVKNAFLSLWAQEATEASDLLDQFRDLIPTT